MGYYVLYLCSVPKCAHLMKYLIVALINYIMIGSKAWQQLNVVHGKYHQVPIAGFILATGEVVIYGSVAITAVSGNYLDAVFLILSLWIGGFIGTMSVMWLHKRYLR